MAPAGRQRCFGKRPHLGGRFVDSEQVDNLYRDWAEGTRAHTTCHPLARPLRPLPAMATTVAVDVYDAIRRAAHPLRDADDDLDPILRMVRDARFVLIG